MNISDLTAEQKQQVLYHLRSAALARSLQWDHELAIETILGREIDADIEALAACIDAPADGLTEEDVGLELDDLEDWIKDEEE